MLHLIGTTQPGFNDAVLRNMFEARKRVFVDLLGWDVPVIAGRFEVDQFDTPEATYVVLAGDEAEHHASARLLRTTRPHILDTLFADLCDEPVPTGPSVYEITRFCLDRSLDARGRRWARNELVSALARFGLSHGISLYTGVAEAGWLEQILAFGWRCRLLGKPRQHGRNSIGAIAVEIGTDTPALLERAGICGAQPFRQEMRHAA